MPTDIHTVDGDESNQFQWSNILIADRMLIYNRCSSTLPSFILCCLLFTINLMKMSYCYWLCLLWCDVELWIELWIFKTLFFVFCSFCFSCSVLFNISLQLYRVKLFNFFGKYTQFKGCYGYVLHVFENYIVLY